jgi:DNA-binding response OmpR family regulator
MVTVSDCLDILVRLRQVSRRAVNSSERRESVLPPEVAAEAPRAAAGVALVVDDEPTVRRLLSTLLRNSGWSVLEAADGAVALSVAPPDLDLLVTDYEMPSGTGVDLARRLRRRHGSLSVLLVSGRPEAAATLTSIDGPRTAFVAKPFPAAEFLASVCAITGVCG